MIDPNLTISALQKQEWDLIVVGGGITGAGILREAARCDLKALLVEQRDYAWGTSSRSSKMVHGGLRYIAQGQIKVTRESVLERERLVKEAPGLVNFGGFTMPHYKGKFPGPLAFGALLTVYDFLAGRKDHSFSNSIHVDHSLMPGLRQEGLQGATSFQDAFVDDARLVLRTLDEARIDGGVTTNYCKVVELLKGNAKGREQVSGVIVEDSLSKERARIKAKVVISATGAWSDILREKTGQKPVVRPLRGSHLVLPFWRVPVAQVCCFMHPDDGRPVYVYPWEGSTVIGTTDLDHPASLNDEPAITSGEIDYLLKAANGEFPSAHIQRDDITSTWSGVRPVISSGKNIDPSKENREHAIWDDSGLISVCGGKLTTFRLIARQALAKAARYLPDVVIPAAEDQSTLFRRYTGGIIDERFAALETGQKTRLHGRFGVHLPAVLNLAKDSEFERVGATDYLWLELRWAARNEQVRHLDDLLLRRTRIGNLLPAGATEYLDRVGQILSEEAGWSEQHWQNEVARYRKLWRTAYSI
ncbi:glycerol-3-phosphate dehydrogenase/oxidase [Sansalvadorimonas verongulae]|uniref:glycerol-3-phosphate dehydrogenase/oxidase n=1 Tax=Sansalvadorimonas verongulae TaxID=2172824 RepID=UPI0012BC3C7F|nr:glycerol-3-phosphate dehydrogenase/oxidase [Sansalvadorimonas verongulae]MTI14453.1 glycerol-3-phosphate dehydrogenase/oxidase [Sansalvadorimonas verongulae]